MGNDRLAGKRTIILYYLGYKQKSFFWGFFIGVSASEVRSDLEEVYSIHHLNLF
jgi:hypothetical protein